MGVKRERAPFVFTPAMKAVMSDDQYEAFTDLCCDVYNILREHSMLLVSLFRCALVTAAVVMLLLLLLLLLVCYE